MMIVTGHDLDALVAACMPADGAAVLAVSGGLDSMVLLDIAAAVRDAGWGGDLVVATFDHASGAHSGRAVAFVAANALQLGLPVAAGRAPVGASTEAAWRAARWDFLRGVAAAAGGVVLTAHTRDDQVETVLMRALRGAGARGLAGLYAETAVYRPFVDVSRRELLAYATARRLVWREDPTNETRRFLRNRVRHDLLPALRRARPAIDDDLLAVARAAAAWRREAAALVDGAIGHRVGVDPRGRPTLDVAAATLAGYSRAALGVVWPELAARAGVALDRRGTERAAEFTMSGRAGHRIQLAGGWELHRSRDGFELRAVDGADATTTGADAARRLETPTTWDRWTFAIREGGEAVMRGDPWIAPLPANRPLFVRRWQAGDRIAVRRGNEVVTRKVKGLLSEAGVSGHLRARWPVVLAGEEIVWIPGVRRSDAATERSGGPAVTYVCDFVDHRP